jgi:large subunit ribosomal protein L4
MSEQVKKAPVKKAAVVTALSLKDVGLDGARKAATPHSFSVAVHSLLQNWRQGTVACKGRSDVTGSTKKPWKQKGTGRARAGDVKSPIWRGGGVTFGPQKRTRTTKVTKAQKKHVMGTLVSQAIEQGIVKMFDWKLNSDLPRTREAFNVLKTVGATGKQTNVFLDAHDLITAASFANIPFVRIVFFDSANVYDLSDASHWIVFKKDVDSFKEMVARWI